MPMKEGPYGHGEQDRPEAHVHRPQVLDACIERTLPALEARFGLSVIVDSPERRAALEAKLAERAAARERVRNSVPATLAMLAAARAGERSDISAPVVPMGDLVQQPQPFEQQAQQYMSQPPQAYDAQPPMANAA